MAAGIAATTADEVKHTIGPMTEIRLVHGVNQVPHFSADGRDALITLGYRANGNAHGYHLALVMLRPSVGEIWNVVGVAPMDHETGRFEDTVRDAPHLGEDQVRAFRFARAVVDGSQATLLVIATRDLDPEQGIPGPSRVTYEIYRLDHSDGDIA